MENNRKEVIESLREQGFRITKQRKILIDIILNKKFSCCKEVYYLALKEDSGIGMATVYRTMDALEKVGALDRENAYRLCREKNPPSHSYLVRLEDNSTVKLDSACVEKMIEEGMQKCGLSKGKKIKEISLLQFDESYEDN